MEVFDAGTTKFCEAQSYVGTTASALGSSSSSSKASSSLCLGGTGGLNSSALHFSSSAAVREKQKVQWTAIGNTRARVLCSNTHRRYDATARGYAVQLETNISSGTGISGIETVLQQNVQLVQPLLCLQMFARAGEKFTIELVFSETETKRDRRRVVISTAFLEMKKSPLHCQVPIRSNNNNKKKAQKQKSVVAKNKFPSSSSSSSFRSKKSEENMGENDIERCSSENTNGQFVYDSWVNFIIPMPQLLKECFGDQAEKKKYAIEKIRVSGTCLIKRILTLRGDRLSSGGFFGEDDYVPSSVDFPNGVERKSILFLSEGENNNNKNASVIAKKKATVSGGGGGGAKTTNNKQKAMDIGQHTKLLTNGASAIHAAISPVRKKQKDDHDVRYSFSSTSSSTADLNARMSSSLGSKLLSSAYKNIRPSRKINNTHSNTIKSSLSIAIEELDYEKLTKVSPRSPSPRSSSFSSFSSSSLTSCDDDDLENESSSESSSYS